MNAPLDLNTTIQDRFYEGERPLFALEHATLRDVRFYPGESALKHTQDLAIEHCNFMGKYPLWHSDRVSVAHSTFTVYARAAIWYTHHLQMRNCLIEAPKMFRAASHLTIEDTRFTSAGETLWNCRDVTLRRAELKGADYVFMNGVNLELEDVRLQGNYSFQDAHNVTIRNAHLDSKDAFWGTRDVTVYDSVIEGEYLGWHSYNLRLVNCTIRGAQPLCYATNLVMENCRLEDADLAFEYSAVDAEIVNEIVSVKNPQGGVIRAPRIGEIILDENCRNPGACRIETACEVAS
ncbi:DUF3737 family protein [Actomonas aquatica]|uniref:DUF3737 family protein n=1 Tax=Actomonas aquatica TaxID=2866162 RepID=A0ABZ1C829_9BACT|nr:DUF3737 family protein [Opitutus sp. WL0086]WRQ87618.1 DUF3737 family protein [Opitutus sp. WL0086]